MACSKPQTGIYLLSSPSEPKPGIVIQFVIVSIIAS